MTGTVSSSKFLLTTKVLLNCTQRIKVGYLLPLLPGEERRSARFVLIRRWKVYPRYVPRILYNNSKVTYQCVRGVSSYA